VPTGRTLRHGEIAEAASHRPIPADVRLKRPEDWRLIGQSIPRVDIRDKAVGNPIYASDVLSLLKNVFRVGAVRSMMLLKIAAAPVTKYIGASVTEAECTEISAHPWVRAIWKRSFRSEQRRAGSPTSRSGGAAFVAMMQTAHFRECDDLAC
jgi:hypothetical protein